MRELIELGFKVVATGGTADYLPAQGLEVERVNKVAQGRPHIVDRIKDGEIALIFNTTEGWQSHQGLRLDPRLGGDAQGSLFHHRGVERGGGAGDRGPAGAQP